MVSKVGSDVKKFKVGQMVAVGCMVLRYIFLPSSVIPQPPPTPFPLYSCKTCNLCHADLQQHCPGRMSTYGTKWFVGLDLGSFFCKVSPPRSHRDSSSYGHPEAKGFTCGGYSSKIVVDQDFVFAVPEGMDLAYVGPLLCAGIT